MTSVTTGILLCQRFLIELECVRPVVVQISAQMVKTSDVVKGGMVEGELTQIKGGGRRLRFDIDETEIQDNLVRENGFTTLM